MISLRLDDYQGKGLYLLFEDGLSLDLSEQAVRRAAETFVHNPEKYSPAIRNNHDFGLCNVCPEKGNTTEICYALRPILPFLDFLDRYVSYDTVTAIYRGDEGLLHVTETSMQNALQHLSILCLTTYCRAGQKYASIYEGVIPVMDAHQIVRRMSLNLYWICRGNESEIVEELARFQEDVAITSQNLSRRLGLICKSDAFLNAFYNMQIAADMLNMNAGQIAGGAQSP